MSKEKKVVTAAAENADVEDTEDTTNEGDETEEVTEAEEGDESEGSDTQNSDKDDKIDFDKELTDEEKRGKPNLTAAQKAFKARQEKREEQADTEDDDAADDDGNKPLTRKDIEVIRADVRREALQGEALVIAKSLVAGHPDADKAAKLIVAKWKNRSFPTDLPLTEQIEEMHAVVFRKKIAGERSEIARALRGSRTVNRAGSGSNADGSQGDSKDAKIPKADAEGLRAAGFSFNGTSRRWEKKLMNGSLLYRDPKTKQTVLVKASKK